MKKKILLVISFFVCSQLFSQITKGNWLIGGSGSFNRIKTEDIKESYLQLSPDIGYFFFDKFVAGLKPSYTFDKLTSATAYGGKSWWIYVGPFVRYYFLNTDKLINILLEGNYQYGFSEATTLYSISNTKSNKLSAFAGPVIYFNSAVGLEILGGYQLNNTSNYPQQSKIVISIGLQFHLEKSKN